MFSIGSHVYVHRCKTVVRTVYSNSNCFKVKVGIHSSALSPLLFVIVTEAREKNLVLHYHGSCSGLPGI